jgi:lipoate-protein ligase A
MKLERWRLLESWECEPALAMGLDEALLESERDVPVLRFYTWKPPAMSLGYFQRFSDVPALAEARAVVRRITGGGAIHHAEELTFSIAISREHALYAGPVADSYRRVHELVAVALARLGLDAELCGERALLSDRAGTGMCFHASTPLDLVWGERKGLGSAQRRAGGRILHHGSIKLARDPLEEGVATIADCGTRMTPHELAELLVEVFSATLGLELTREEPDPEELALAGLRATRFAEPAFLHRR